MSRTPSSFRQRDVTAAIKGTIAAGIRVSRIEVGKDGRIVVVTDKAADATEVQQGNEWDGVS